ncbi:MAG: cryptochrome/photolyase family protein [Sinobacteraceae bacterium]|nr:cryptochrome/photolyase family protein [Nevskiaceae bacterium]
MSVSPADTCRHLVVVLGDQLDESSAALDGFDPARDCILQMEVREEATYVPQHKLRLAFFFSSMRHFRERQRQLGRRVIYRAIDDPDNRHSFVGEIAFWADKHRPQRILMLEPGDWRVREQLATLALPIEWRSDRHFLCSGPEFAQHAQGRQSLRLDEFYRRMRRRFRVLLEADGSPVGGAWSFDADNRASFGRKAVPELPPAPRCAPDALTREVLALVQREFPDSPGKCARFDFPVTRQQALHALHDFVANRLGDFGRYQDAMHGGEPFLFHSQLSGALNLHLLSPREVLEAVLANPAGAPLNSIEGFVRQILGWREYVHGIYCNWMPHYAQANVLAAELPMPRFYWTGETEMRCLAEAIGHTIDHAYAHHIERLMVLGLFCLLLGVRPYDVHRWHLSMFRDAIDWVSLPNVIGMSQHADGGRMATKPYVASGQYINRMSNHCRQCRFDPKKALGDDACPFTTLYWDFLERHAERFATNPRMQYQYKNLNGKPASERAAIRRRAQGLKNKFTADVFL